MADDETPPPTLKTDENWQTQARGSDAAEYAIYRATAESLGWVVKSFDEWLAS